MVVLLGNGVLRREPQVLLGVERELEATVRKALDARVEVVNTLSDTRTGVFVDELADFGPVLARVDELDLARARHADLDVFVHIAVCVTRDGDRLLPIAHDRADARNDDRRAEARAVENRANGAVGAFPHLFKPVFLDARRVRRDRRAFHRDAEALGCLAGVDGDLVVGRVAHLKAQIVVLGLEIDIRFEQLLLDKAPDNARHLIAVHLDQRRFHLNLRHRSPIAKM